MFLYLGWKFWDGSRVKTGHAQVEVLCFMSVADHCVTILFSFLTCLYSPRELSFRVHLEYDDRMRESLYEGVLFPISKPVLEFVQCINI